MTRVDAGRTRAPRARPDHRRRRHRRRARARPRAPRAQGHARRTRRVHVGDDGSPPRAAAQRARYAVNDHESAVECIEENTILRRIAPGSFEENDGLFVAITDEDMAYLPGLPGRAAPQSGIPTQELTPRGGDRARAHAEPRAEGRRPRTGRHDGRHADAAAVLRDREAQRRVAVELHRGDRAPGATTGR